MALLKCSDCGTNISEKAKACPKCGCPLSITKQLIVEEEKRKIRKKVEIFSYIFGAIVLLCIICFTVNYCFVPYNIAVRMVKKDFGKNIKIQEVYYNADVNGCIVYFTVKGKSDIAMVHLDNKTVGYKSILDEYTNKSNSSNNDTDKQKNAADAVAYMSLYDIIWEYNLVMYGTESGWEKVK